MKIFILLSSFLLIISSNAKAQNWILKKNKGGVKVFTKVNPQSPFNLLKAESEIDVPLLEVLNLVFDVSRHTAWVYNAVKSVPVKKKSQYDIVYYGETYAPWPVSNRDLVIHLTAITDSLTGICIIKAISEPKLKPEVDGKIRVPRSVAEWKLVPLTNKTTQITYTLDIDPGGSLPAWLVNFATVEGPYLSFIKMKELLQK